MRRNNYTSASDRRWQRRYERIQQRREEELERRDRQGRDDAYETISAHDLGIDTIVASAPTFTFTMPSTYEPNMNGTLIPESVWDDAWARYCNQRANESQRSQYEDIVSYLATDESNSEERSRLWLRIREAFYKEISDAYWAKDQRLGEEIHERTAQDDDLVPTFEPEPELEAGDSADLDSFLGNFLAPGT